MPGGAEVAAGADGDVVDHDRHRAGVGDRPEVRDDAGLGRAHVVRHDDRARRRAPACPRAPATAAIVVRGAVGAGADDQLRAALGADARRTRRSTARFSSASSAGDSPVVPSATMPAQPASRYSWHRALDRVEGDRAVGRERRDERDVDALEQSTSARPGHGREGTAPASSRAPAKTVVEHRLREPTGERVLLLGW